ncbi:PH domain-containing protein [uncultured Polaribacter sp.]|uniref:PH domain-containing protein n=1 Tax=uncultured Polaribacter sp. TaxID=174711 RepID=UPI0026121957|nr:PH domain-containing protein [uncultured Polaribacter sp.]
MGNTTDFKHFTKQSKKGILVIYINLLYKVFKAIWVLLFLFIQKFSKISEDKLVYIYGFIAFILLFFLIRAYLIFKNFQFKIDKEYFVLKQGIFKKTNTEIPFDRIQNINFKQNIIQQIINVHEVNIETAGSTKAEISIKALAFNDAKALKNAITIYDKKETIVEKVTKEKPFLKIGFLELLKVSLTENHLQSLLLLFAVLVGFFQQINDLFDGLGQKETIDKYISENTSALETSVFLIVGFLILLTITAVLSSVVRVVFKHFNLTVYIKNNALEIYQGLTTKKSVILKRNKIQHITIATNPIKKILGISFITFKQAISGKVAGKKQKDKIIRIVGCKTEQINQIKKLLAIHTQLEEIPFQKSNKYLKIRNYIRSLFFFIPLNLLFYFGMEEYNAFWINILVIPMYLISVHFFYKKRIFKFSEDVLCIGFGILETHNTYLPFYKVQNIKLKQTIFQERKNVADLIFQTASGKLKIPCIDLEKAMFIYNYTLFKVESSTKSWM